MIDRNVVQGQRKSNIPLYIKIESSEEFWVKKSRKSFADFFFYMTEQKLAPHHIKWVKEILGRSSSKTNIIAPRGSGKTTVLNMLMAWWIGKKPYTTNALISVSADQAKVRLADIRDIVESPRYKNVFTNVSIDTKRPRTKTEFSVWSSKWKNEDRVLSYLEWRTKIRSDKTLDSKSKTLIAVGINSAAIPGSRFNGIVLIDDPHDEKNSATESQRQKIENLVKKTLIGCMTPDARIALICTRWAETDLSGRLREDKKLDGEPVWITIETKAILDDGTSYWKDVWTLDMLQERRELIGEVMFQLMYMNNPLGLSSGEFTIDMLRNALPETLPRFKDVVISVDLSATVSDRADWTVFTIMARDKPRKQADGTYAPTNVYVLDMMRIKKKFNDCIENLADFYNYACELFGDVKSILFEKQGFQVGWSDALKVLRPDIRVTTVPLTNSKEFRAKLPAAKAQAGRMFFNTKMKSYEAMCSELIAFPNSEHDDIVDTISLPFVYWAGKKTGAGRSGTLKVESQFLR